MSKKKKKRRADLQGLDTIEGISHATIDPQKFAEEANRKFVIVLIVMGG